MNNEVCDTRDVAVTRKRFLYRLTRENFYELSHVIYSHKRSLGRREASRLPSACTASPPRKTHEIASEFDHPEAR